MDSNQILDELHNMLDQRLPHSVEDGTITLIGATLEGGQDDNELEEIIVLEKTIALLKNNPDQAEMIWETFMNLLDCASRSEANHWFGYTIGRF
tara:strand:+ start:907 stop:1188 length:282 start_codon:yes stop_codon:yes gene_type:complete